MSNTPRPVADLLTIYADWLTRLNLPRLFEWTTGVRARMDMSYNVPSGVESMTPAGFVELVRECAADLIANAYEVLFLPDSDEDIKTIWDNNGIYCSLALDEVGRPAGTFLDAKQAYDTAADDAVIKMAKEQVNTILDALSDLERLLTLPPALAQ